MTGIEAETSALDLGAPELAEVGGEEDLGLVFEKEGTEECCVVEVAF